MVLVTALLPGCSSRVSSGIVPRPVTFFDAGGVVVDQSSTFTHVFTLKNNLNRDLKILGFEKSSGCLTASIDRDLVAPGREASLTLTARLEPNYSARMLSCAVKTDDPGIAATNYTLALKTFPRVQFRPIAFNLGLVRRSGTPGADGESSVDAWLEMFRAAGQELDSPERFEAPEGVGIAVCEGPSTDEPAKGVVRTSYPLKIKIPHDRLVGAQKGIPEQLTIVSHTRRGARGILPVTWRIRNPIEAVPGRLHFGTLSGPKSGLAGLVVRSAEDRAFRILSLKADESASVMLVAPESIGPNSHPSKVHSLSLRLELKNPLASAAAGSVVVETDDASCPSLTVYWSAFLDRPKDAPATFVR